MARYGGVQRCAILRDMILAVILAVILAGLFAGPAAAGGVSLDHRYYQDSAGRPRFLIGYYGWAAVPDGYFIDHPSRYSSMIRRGAPYHINYIRISLGVNRFTRQGGRNQRATPVPFDYLNGKADLDRWDPVFWHGLKRQCQLARQNGFLVHISIFDGVELRPQGGAGYGYRNSFWNPANQTRNFYPDPDLNHDGGIEQNGEFYQVEAFNHSTGIGYYQRKLIRKTIAETSKFDNVLFEIGNELLSSPAAWNTAVIHEIKARTTVPVSQCGGVPGKDLMGWSLHSGDTPAAVKATVASLVGRGFPAWLDPDGSALSDLHVSPEDLRHAAWYAFAGGAACWGGFTQDFWTGGPGFNTRKAEYYKNLELFIKESGVPFWRMSPAQGLVSSSDVNSCLARPGHEYLIYVLSDDTVNLDLGAVTGDVVYRTYDPASGQWSGLRRIEGGKIQQFRKPVGARDWVLYAAAVGKK